MTIDRYRDDLIRYFRKRVPRDSVEDFTHDTLMQAYAYVRNGNRLDKPLAFLYVTANNVIKKNHRDNRLQFVTDHIADFDVLNFAANDPVVEQRVIAELDFDAFCRAITKLPRQCRRVFVLRKVYGYSYNEIADHFSISVNTVKSQIRRGVVLLGGYYKESLNGKRS